MFDTDPLTLLPTAVAALQSMRGRRVVVEMKNDVEISGILVETDQYMK